jgi:hypothetical protein
MTQARRDNCAAVELSAGHFVASRLDNFGFPSNDERPVAGKTNNMIITRFTELVGCAIPIQQAGMGAVAPPKLAAADRKPAGSGCSARPIQA